MIFFVLCCPTQQMKKFTEEYMSHRQVQIARFLDYCLQSETIKQDFLFERFLDQTDQQEYKKTFSKLGKTVEEIKHLNQITGLVDEPQGIEFDLPDKDRIKNGMKTQKTLQQIMRICNSSNQRIFHNMKRLSSDMRQMRQTMAQVREDVKTLEVMEQRMATEFTLDNKNIETSLGELDTMII